MAGKILESLNPRQREAVTYCDGPQVVLAGAGSGKTKVLTTKIAYLIEEMGVRPWRILALTFTNKAAREMRSRAEALLDGDLRGLEVSTFHAYGLRFLHRYSDALTALGYPYPFVIFDRSDAKSVVKRAMAELNINPKNLELNEALDIISQAKTKANPVSREPKVSDRWRTLFDTYQRSLKEQGALDFDDLMVLPLHILAT
ncbi:MAG: UvrD-helicase domain-containing protein, partial [Synergistes sp.]|nr:UvrD-helicase domain-containing protein [Synergistes sp.]